MVVGGGQRALGLFVKLLTNTFIYFGAVKKAGDRSESKSNGLRVAGINHLNFSLTAH